MKWLSGAKVGRNEQRAIIAEAKKQLEAEKAS